MGKILWMPSEERVSSSNMYRFMKMAGERHSFRFNGYASLYRWSIEYIAEFWKLMWEFADIRASVPYDKVMVDSD